MTHSEQINEISAALAKAQKAIKGAKKDSDNPFFKSKYADLASVADACREPLADNGIAVVQAPSSTEDGRVSVTTMLLHASGQWMSETLSVKPKDDGPQAMGSVITYLRRYSLAAFAGVAPEDDDGEAAEGRKSQKKIEPAKPAKFDGWMADLDASAEEGVDILKATWEKSAPELRMYLTATDQARWERIKAKAQKAVSARA